MKEYYDPRVPEYDEWYQGLGRFAPLARPAARSHRRGRAWRPFEDGSFDRVFTAHFYGHLEHAEREAFLAAAPRVAPELVVVDSAVRPDRRRVQWQERVLNDGSRFEVYKRYFDAEGLARELDGGTVLHAGRWFAAVISRVIAPDDATGG